MAAHRRLRFVRRHGFAFPAADLYKEGGPDKLLKTGDKAPNARAGAAQDRARQRVASRTRRRGRTGSGGAGLCAVAVDAARPRPLARQPMGLSGAEIAWDNHMVAL